MNDKSAVYNELKLLRKEKIKLQTELDLLKKYSIECKIRNVSLNIKKEPLFNLGSQKPIRYMNIYGEGIKFSVYLDRFPLSKKMLNTKSCKDYIYSQFVAELLSTGFINDE